MSSNRRPTKCRAQKIGKVNVLKVTGRLTPDENDDVILSTVKQLAEAGEKDFLIDLNSVNYINSTGVGTLIHCYRLAQSKGGNLKLLNPSQSVTHIIQVSKLDSIFEVYQDQNLAIESFNHDDSLSDNPKKGRTRKQASEEE
ncbi:MAG: STAS domain-containing protein [Acidobacteria bacterium]|nr:STAS domain-containing protein [Acidobacteriota bacterium]